VVVVRILKGVKMAKIPKPRKLPPLSKKQQKVEQQQIAQDKVRKRLGLKAQAELNAVWKMLADLFAATARLHSERDPSYWKHPEPGRSRLMKSITVRSILP
jgi:hypothetical protein